MPDPNEDFAGDVAQAAEQLRNEPEHDIASGSEDIAALVTERLDDHDEARLEDQGEQGKTARDARGRFSRREQEGDEQHRQENVPEQRQQLNGPPSSWSKQAKSEWNRLSPAIQQAVEKREREIVEGFRQIRERGENHDAIERLMAPRRQYLGKFGFKSDPEAINHLLQFSDAYDRDPASVIRHLAQHKGLDVQQLLSGPPSPAEQAHQAQLLEAARHTVREYESRAPEYYQAVKPVMRMLLQAGIAADMQDAYNKAIAPYQSMLASRNGTVAKKIKASNASLSGAPHGVSSSKQSNGAAKGAFQDVAADVRAALEQLS